MYHPWSQSHNPYNTLGPFAIPHENTRRCPGGQQTNPNDVPKTINGNRYFIYTTSIFWVEEDITKDAPYGSDGHAIHVMCDKIKTIFQPIKFQQQRH